MPSTHKKSDTESRGRFSSRISFIMAAAGCAVGVGNIWSFPTQAAQNGGAAFVLVYLFFSFILAYPALVAELTIGRYSQSNPVSALTRLSTRASLVIIGRIAGLLGLLTLTIIYSFYSIIGGWFITHAMAPLFKFFEGYTVAIWLTDFNATSTVIATLAFMGLTTLIVTGGVKNGIERWCNRLMPALFMILALLIIFALFRPGGVEGLKAYLIPNFSHLLNQKLLISAMGQSFFSMSLGVGCMMVYGSYLGKTANLPLTAFQVTIVDSSVAFLAGMLIMPCMYAAMRLGVDIYAPDGSLYNANTLVFTVLPELFQQLGFSGLFASFVFYILLVIAALTSSISLIEPTTSYLVEHHALKRNKSSWLVTMLSAMLSVTIIVNIDRLLTLAIQLTTQYLQPLLCLVLIIFASWVMRQNRLLKELCQGYPEIERSLFWKVWPWYVKIVCPMLILLLFTNHW